MRKSFFLLVLLLLLFACGCASLEGFLNCLIKEEPVISAPIENQDTIPTSALEQLETK